MSTTKLTLISAIKSNEYTMQKKEGGAEVFDFSLNIIGIPITMCQLKYNFKIHHSNPIETSVRWHLT